MQRGWLWVRVCFGFLKLAVVSENQGGRQAGRQAKKTERTDMFRQKEEEEEDFVQYTSFPLLVYIYSLVSCQI